MTKLDAWCHSQCCRMAEAHADTDRAARGEVTHLIKKHIPHVCSKGDCSPRLAAGLNLLHKQGRRKCLSTWADPSMQRCS